MRAAVVLLVAAALAGCAEPSAGPQERAWDWLLAQRDAEGRWPVAFVPHVVEAAVASGKDPSSWPSPVPLAQQLAWPAEDVGYMDSLRPLLAWALLPEDGGRGDEVERRVLAGYDGRQFGEPGLLNDDAYALLALNALGEGLAANRGASFAENQGADGGWSWAPGGRSETDMTGIALSALAGGYDAGAARAFLDGTHVADGGHSMHVGGAANCDSTVWAIHGYGRLGVEAPADDRAYLASLQRDDGSLAYKPAGQANALCTVEAVALLGSF